MKKITKLLLIILALLVLVGCSKSEYTYEKQEGKYIISEYTGTSSYLVVPDLYDGIEVAVIGYNTYAYNIFIYHASIGSNVSYIQGCAFWYCTNLEDIYIPKSVKMIENYAFYNCTKLKNVYYEGSSSDYINIMDNNDCLLNAASTYNVSLDQYKEIIGESKIINN